MNEVLRQEKKYLINISQFYKYSNDLCNILSLDEHSDGEGYLIRSLYFDTLDDKDYEEKEDGVELRRKIRLRNYGPETPFAMLEMKQKQGANQKKRSLRMKREDAKRLSVGDYPVLLNYDEPFAAECYSLMNMLCYRPKAVITYHRKAFVAKENKIRITFDHHIVGTESCYDIFADQLLENSILDPCLVVMEVKYNGFLLSYIKDMLRECDSSELSVSKYCLGRAVSKHYRF
ncbi:polyphosphate polymerase domain-containing protein [Murimonas intestini]|uniref:VTC domain-containing protein n=1 Tax=Murimonas intestini TaxID=1337051 RepID=A0AB73T9R9_9FIRM|nr:polyphosphate polymerase domain-containing protein [Murimonas intestini]MCR1839177.1 polyphosphate polymerase domain-containing protein [Murimonas intestini]MCR1864473.1 polyphosphate polymerase domain-containing protein [Murimonas intestini]MCR1882083.1 polyphosphate polymerase domain-containing protein [Murimonas intestini]